MSLHLSESLAEMVELREFLIARRLQADHTWVGMSSDAMIDAAIQGEPYASFLPHDTGDLARCEKTYDRAPAFLKARMLPMLELGRRAAAEKGIYCRGCDTFGHNSTIHNLCGACAGSRR